MSRSQPRRAAKRDGNEARIIQVLRDLGATVQQLNDANAPDLLVGHAGKTFLLEVKNKGGKLTPGQAQWHDAWHGQPVPVTGVVQALSDGEFDCELADNHFAAFYGRRIAMGPCARLRVGGVNNLLTTRKTPPFDLGQLRHIGIEPETQKMIVVKSAVAYRAAYLPIAAGIIEMDTAGMCTADLSRFPYQHWRPNIKV